MCRTCCIAIGTESILARSIYEKVRNFNLAASGTEQKQPCVPVTCPTEGSGQTRSCLQVQAIYGHMVWVSFIITPFPVQNTNVQVPHLSSLLGQQPPLFGLHAVHMQAVVLLLWLGLWCRFGLVVGKEVLNLSAFSCAVPWLFTLVQ